MDVFFSPVLIVDKCSSKETDELDRCTLVQMSRTRGQSRSNLTGAHRTSAHRLKYKKGTTKILWTGDFWIVNISVYTVILLIPL